MQTHVGVAYMDGFTSTLSLRRADADHIHLGTAENKLMNKKFYDFITLNYFFSTLTSFLLFLKCLI